MTHCVYVYLRFYVPIIIIVTIIFIIALDLDESFPVLSKYILYSEWGTSWLCDLVASSLPYKFP